jgi:hypothetical protein
VSRPALALLARTWLTIAAIDGIFASCLSRFAYHSTVTRVWQGVASTVLGPAAMDGGLATVFLGIAMHIGVALFWSTVFVTLALLSPAVRRAISTPGGVLGVAAIYGPLVWLFMSAVVVASLTGKPPTYAFRWWVQLVGHIFFVALPIVWTVSRGIDRVIAAAPRAVPSVA